MHILDRVKPLNAAYRWLFKALAAWHFRRKGDAEAAPFPWFADEQLSHATLWLPHTKPGEISTELERLQASYRGLQQRFQRREPDFILAGDLNASLFSTANNRTADRYFTGLFGQYQIAIRRSHIPTMVQSRYVNDNLLWDDPTIEDHTNSTGVAAFDSAPPFNPSSGSSPGPALAGASRISDHRLVWAEFWTNRDSE